MNKCSAVIELQGEELEQVKRLKDAWGIWKEKDLGDKFAAEGLESWLWVAEIYLKSIATNLLTQILIDCESMDGVEHLTIKMEVCGNGKAKGHLEGT